LRRPCGADGLLPTTFPTLKRGANNHCAYGAVKIEASLLHPDSCDCPAFAQEVRGASAGGGPQLPHFSIKRPASAARGILASKTHGNCRIVTLVKESPFCTDPTGLTDDFWPLSPR
jgi:hypothetical protein